MKKFVATIGGLSLATSLVLAQTGSSGSGGATAGTQRGATNTGIPPSYQHDPAFGASGGSGHSVGVRGGTHSGPMVSTPNPSAGASVNNTNAPSAPGNR